MAMSGVLRPGHMQLKVLDLDESVDFYTNVVGLIQTGREGDRACTALVAHAHPLPQQVLRWLR